MLKRLDQSEDTAPRVGAEMAKLAGQIDFDMLLAILRRQSKVLVIAAIAGLIIGFADIMTAVPLYTATTDLLIDSQKNTNDVATTIADLTFDSGAIDSQVEVLKSEKVAMAVISELKLTKDPEFMGQRGSLIGQAFATIRSVFDFNRWFVTRENRILKSKYSSNALRLGRSKAVSMFGGSDGLTFSRSVLRRQIPTRPRP